MTVPGTILHIYLHFRIESIEFSNLSAQNVAAICGTVKTVPYEKTGKLTNKPKFAPVLSREPKLLFDT